VLSAENGDGQLTTRMSSDKVGLASSILTPSRMQKIHNTISRESIFNSVKVIKQTGIEPSSGLNIIYGPSSNVPMINHIRNILGESAFPAEPDAFWDGTRQDGGYSVWSGRGEISQLNHVSERDTAEIVFLRYEVANGFLDIYLRTTHYSFPVVSTEALRSGLDRMYDSVGEGNLQPSHRALLLTAMGIGASHKTQYQHGSALFARAKRELGQVSNENNLQAIQASLLMISKSSLLVRLDD
jgi:hypothetical protein